MYPAQQSAKLMIAAVERGRDPFKVIQEVVSHEDELSTTVGLGSGAAASKLGSLGYKKVDSKSFPAGSVEVWGAPDPEHPSNSARAFVVVGSDGSVKSIHQDASATRDAEWIATAIVNIAKQQGLNRAAGSATQEPDGGSGYVVPQAG